MKNSYLSMTKFHFLRWKRGIFDIALAKVSFAGYWRPMLHQTKSPY